MNITQQTKDKILAAAQTMFFDMGYSKTTLRKIAYECDITHSAIFKHFKNKQEIASSIIGNYYELLYEKVNACAALEDWGDNLNIFLLFCALGIHYTTAYNYPNFSKFYSEVYNEEHEVFERNLFIDKTCIINNIDDETLLEGWDNLFLEKKTVSDVNSTLVSLCGEQKISVKHAMRYMCSLLWTVFSISPVLKLEMIDAFADTYKEKYFLPQSRLNAKKFDLF